MEDKKEMTTPVISAATDTEQSISKCTVNSIVNQSTDFKGYMNIFESVKEKVSARQAAEQYGIRVNRNGMACCPFHNDRHPSMKIDKGYYCFACGEKGDVIHFVEKLFGIRPYEAARKLAEDFEVTIEKKQKSSKRVSHKRVERNPYQTAKTFHDWVQYCIRVLSDYLRYLEELKKKYAPVKMDEEWNTEFCNASSQIPIIDNYLEILLNGSLEEQIHFMSEKGREVKDIAGRLDEYRRRDAQADGRSSVCDGISA